MFIILYTNIELASQLTVFCTQTLNPWATNMEDTLATSAKFITTNHSSTLVIGQMCQGRDQESKYRKKVLCWSWIDDLSSVVTAGWLGIAAFGVWRLSLTAAYRWKVVITWSGRSEGSHHWQCRHCSSSHGRPDRVSALAWRQLGDEFLNVIVLQSLEPLGQLPLQLSEFQQPGERDMVIAQ